MKHTEKELYNFIWRADTNEKIAKAVAWLKKNVTDNDLFDDLMTELSIQSRNINRAEEGRQLI